FVFFSLCGRTTNNALALGSLDDKEIRILTNASSSPVYSPPGYLLFVRGNDLYAQPFDAGKLRLAGDPFPVAQNIPVIGDSGPTALGAFSVSRNGTLLYRTGGGPELYQFEWFDRSGKSLGTVGPPGEYAEPALSPDEKRVVYQ